MGAESDGRDPVVDLDRTLQAGTTPPSAERVVVRRNTPLSVPIERYERVSVHAEGGLGRVWRARDHLLDRDVALKDLRPETDVDGSRRRLVDEARICGRLEHPGIVPVYDLAPGSAPYYTMRMVAGRTLAEAARAYHAGPRDPVALQRLLNAFVTVCNTIEYAHAQGVIHRDLKGSNILVGDYGEVIVLDWGLAKRRGDPDDGDDLLGTPTYMAPEQARRKGEAVDERTDVHGLGAVLYEILTGRAPFEGDNLEAVLARVTAPERTPPRAHSPKVPRALEAVCLRALACERDRRYPSARALGEDLQRYLADEPVTAYREGLTKRLMRFARRHRTATVTAAALTITATVGLVVGNVLLQRANAQTEAQRDEARHNFLEARAAVDTYLTTVSEDQLLDAPGLQPLRERLLSEALTYYQRFIDEHGDDPALTLSLADAKRRLGVIMGGLARHDEAIAQLDAAIAVYRRLPETSEDARLGTAQTLLAIAELAPPKRALEAATAAVAAYEPLARTHPNDPAVLVQLGRAYDALAGAQYHNGKRFDVAASEDRAVQIFEDVNRRFPGDVERQRLLALAYNNDGNATQITGNQVDAVPLFEKSLALIRPLAAQHPESQLIRRELGRAASAKGKALVVLGQITASLAPTKEGVAVLRVLAAENPRIDSYARQLDLAIGYEGQALLTAGRITEARPLIDEATSIGDARVAISKDVDDAKDATGWWHVLGGRAARLVGDDRRAAEELAKAIALFDAALADQPANDDWLYDRAQARQEQLERSRDAAAHAALVADWRKLIALAPRNPLYQVGLADALRRLGELPGDGAASAASEAVAIMAKLASDNPRDLGVQVVYARTLIARARGALRTGDRAAADGDLAIARAVLAAAADHDPAYLPDLACVETVASRQDDAVAAATRARDAGFEELARQPCLAPIARRLH